MADSEETVMIEGFLCPICKVDLGTAVKLLSHFQEEHSNEQDLLKSFKELFGKAKKKILKQDDSGEYVTSPKRQSPGHNSIQWEPQEIGATSSHMKFFESVRNARLQRFSVPTNQLIIRLDKLLENMPTDPLKKKAHEQNVVPWLDGTSVTRCPNCTRSFHLARRQHHCRLCGSILCHDCSVFLPIQTARKYLDKPQEGADLSSEHTLRICYHCLTLLENREQLKESRNSKPIISQFYERLREYKAQADEHAAMYIKMCTSLNAGESPYHLNDAQVLRVKVLRLAESIDTLSGKIAVLGTKDTERTPSIQALRLQKAIRTSATSYLRCQLLSLPTLPTEEQLKAAQERRRQKIAAQIQEEKLREARMRNAVYKQGSPQHRRSPDSAFSVGQGWVPEKKQFFKSDDPLIQQMNIIRTYIQEARAAHKYDEVASLEANLKELKEEYWRCQQQEEEQEGRLDETDTASLQDASNIKSTHADDIAPN